MSEQRAGGDIVEQRFAPRFVVHFGESLSWLTEACPKPGDDQDAINAWHDLFGSLLLYLPDAAQFVAWDEGVRLARALSDHWRAQPDSVDADDAIPWWRELDRRAAEFADAAQIRWPHVLPLDEGDA